MEGKNETKEGEVTIEEKPKNLLDNDKLRKLASDEVDFDTLTPEEKTEFHTRFVEGNEEGVPTLEEEKSAKNTDSPNNQELQNQIQPQKPLEQNTTLIEGEGDTADTQELKRKLKSERDANNTLQQRLSSAKSKLESLEASRVPEPPKIEDALDENLTKQDKWNRSLATRLNSHVDNESKAIQKEKIATEQSLLYSDISILQTENPELRTSLPVESIDKTYVRFRDGLAGISATNDEKNEAVNKFFTDSEFRKGKEGEGHVFPVNDTDWNGYKKITELINFKRNGGNNSYDPNANGDKYQELDVAYYKYKKNNGIIPDPVKQAVLEATTKVVDQVAGNQNKPNLLSPEIGKSSEGLDGMTEQQAEQWLIDHPTPSTPAEVAMLKSILNKYSPSSNTQNQEVVF